MKIKSLLSKFNSNPKTAKSVQLGYGTAILHLAPASMSGFQVCQYRSPGCEAACLHFAGATHYQKGKNAARIRRTRFFFEHRQQFMERLYKDIQLHIDKMKKLGLKPAIRLNGTSDIPWERVRFRDKRNIMEAFPNVIFYDYTAIPERVVPDNYHLTFSMKENNSENSHKAQVSGINVAVVFFDKDLPSEFMGLKVINGDEHDLRFLDEKGVIVGLKAKGSKAKADKTGFIHG